MEVERPPEPAADDTGPGDAAAGGTTADEPAAEAAPGGALATWWAARRARGRRTWGQRGVLAAGCAVTVGLLVSASSLSYVYDKFEKLPRVELSGVLDAPAEAGEPENFLIVGVDNAFDLEDGDPVLVGRQPSELSDTIMVLRIDPESRQAALLSLPRDLWVPIPGTGSNQKINSARQRGGPDLLIETVADNFGIPINHYVEVDFASFKGLVEAIDGVPIFNGLASRDRATGLYVTDLGCVTLDPTQALAYVRSRHYEQLVDGEWESDPSSDLGRIDRQQDFIQRAISRAIDKGASNPATLDRLINVGLDGIAVDDSLSADDIFRLGNRFRNFEPNDLITYSVPVVPDYAGEAAILRLVTDEAEPILDVFRGGRQPGAQAAVPDESDDEDGDGDDDRRSGGARPDNAAAGPSLAPEAVTLQVLNGSGASGQAAEATRLLAGIGFSVVGTGEMAEFDDDDTIVQYPPGQLAQAATVSRWLAAGADLEESDEVSTVAVITGSDWRGVLDEPRSPGASREEPSSDDTDDTAEGDPDDTGADDGTDVTGTDVTGTDGTEGPDEGLSGTGSATTERPSLTTAPPAPGSGSELTTTTADLSANPC